MRKTEISKGKSRKDANGKALRAGETQQANGRYRYNPPSSTGLRDHPIYARSLEELREKEEEFWESYYAKGTVGVKGAGLKLVDVCDLAMRDKERLGLRPQTIQEYRKKVKRYIEPFFGSKKIGDVTREDCWSFRAWLDEEKGLSHSTISSTLNVLNAAMGYAASAGYVRGNVMDNITAYRVGTPPKAPAIIDEEDAKEFMAFLNSDGKYARILTLYMTAAATGLRIGELCGLRWANVDLEKKEIHVIDILAKVDDERGKSTPTIQHAPKTKSGERYVHMTDTVIAMLQQERKRQKKAGIVCTWPVSGYDDFVFLNTYGHVWTADSAGRAFKKAKVEFFLAGGHIDPTATLHAWRHFFCTMLEKYGVPTDDIARVAGHRHDYTTRSTYIHRSNDLVNKKMDSVFNGLLSD